ncbi:MAG: aminotransferase class IV family protein [Candidatus Saccharibacteria bacterium]|nr:aminotransferase class IV family protein [Pseudorhodobacter sp.]
MEDALRAGAGDPGLTLIETLGWTGTAFPRLGLHMQRLHGSAARLGWGCDVAAVEAALRAAVGVVPVRVRMTLDMRGRVEVTVAPIPPVKPVWAVGLAPVRLALGDPWLGVKSSRRAVYDAARAAMPDGLDEVVLVNERGEVCDGSITTLFYDRGQGMRTPPLSSGLLPGVLRAEMAVPEEVLAVGDLPLVRLWVGNSLRGLMAARWVG